MNRYHFTLAVLTLAVLVHPAIGNERVIGGTVLATSKVPQVLSLQHNDHRCTGVIVGPKAILTAAHCFDDKTVVKATFGTQTLSEAIDVLIIRSPNYPALSVDHDLALGVPLNHIFEDGQIATLGESPLEGANIRIVGYGSTSAENAETSFNEGSATIIEARKLTFISKGAAVSWGDAGAPALSEMAGATRPRIVGIAAKGNLIDRSYFTGLHSLESTRFLNDVSKLFSLEICGLNVVCD